LVGEVEGEIELSLLTKVACLRSIRDDVLGLNDSTGKFHYFFT
jgi:hypothetical protein